MPGSTAEPIVTHKCYGRAYHHASCRHTSETDPRQAHSVCYLPFADSVVRTYVNLPLLIKKHVSTIAKGAEWEEFRSTTGRRY